MKDHLGMQPSKPTDLESRPDLRPANDRKSVISMLNEALSMELECVLRYRRHHFASPGAGGVAGFTVAAEMLEHSNEELAHADRLAARITQLGGVPIWVPRSTEGHTTGHEPTLREMLMDDLSAERAAVNTYASFVRTVSDTDPTSRRLLEDILAQEEDHVEDMEDFLRHLAIPA